MGVDPRQVVAREIASWRLAVRRARYVLRVGAVTTSVAFELMNGQPFVKRVVTATIFGIIGIGSTAVVVRQTPDWALDFSARILEMMLIASVRESPASFAGSD